MPAFLAPLLLRLAPAWAFVKRNAVPLILVAFGLVLLASVYVVYSRGKSAGGKEVEVRVEKQHTETIREVRADEQLAQKITDAVDARLAAAQAAQRAETAKTTKEITDAFQALPPAPAGTIDRAAPAGVRDASNSLVDRANRAAEYTGPAD